MINETAEALPAAAPHWPPGLVPVRGLMSVPHLLIDGLNRYHDEPCLFLGDKVASYRDVRETTSPPSRRSSRRSG